MSHHDQLVLGTYCHHQWSVSIVYIILLISLCLVVFFVIAPLTMKTSQSTSNKCDSTLHTSNKCDSTVHTSNKGDSTVHTSNKGDSSVPTSSRSDTVSKMVQQTGILHQSSCNSEGSVKSMYNTAHQIDMVSNTTSIMPNNTSTLPNSPNIMLGLPSHSKLNYPIKEPIFSSHEVVSNADNYKAFSQGDKCSCGGPHTVDSLQKIISLVATYPDQNKCKDNLESNNLDVDIPHSKIDNTKMTYTSSPHIIMHAREVVSLDPAIAKDTGIINTISAEPHLSSSVPRKRNIKEVGDDTVDEETKASKMSSSNFEHEFATSMKRKRRRFSEIERTTLEGFYSDIVYHGKRKSIEDIQNVLELDKHTINTWFRNRKCKETKEELVKSLKNMSSVANKLYELPDYFLGVDSEDDTLYIDEGDSVSDVTIDDNGNDTICDNYIRRDNDTICRDFAIGNVISLRDAICDNDVICDNDAIYENDAICDIINIESTHGNGNTNCGDRICGKETTGDDDMITIRHPGTEDTVKNSQETLLAKEAKDNCDNVAAVGLQTEVIAKKNIRINVSDLVNKTGNLLDSATNCNLDSDVEKVAITDVIPVKLSENIDTSTMMNNVITDVDGAVNIIYSPDHLTGKDNSDTTITDTAVNRDYSNYLWITKDVINYLVSTVSKYDNTDSSDHVSISNDVLDTTTDAVNDFVTPHRQCDITYSSKQVITDLDTMESADDSASLDNMVIDLAESYIDISESTDSEQPVESCTEINDNTNKPSTKTYLNAVASEDDVALKGINAISSSDVEGNINSSGNRSFSLDTSSVITGSSNISPRMSQVPVSTPNECSDTETIPYMTDDEKECVDTTACEPFVQDTITWKAKKDSNLDILNELSLEYDIVRPNAIFVHRDTSIKNGVHEYVSKAIDVDKLSDIDVTSSQSHNTPGSTCNKNISLDNDIHKIENASMKCTRSVINSRVGQCVVINSSTRPSNKSIGIRECTVNLERININKLNDGAGCLSYRGARYLKRKFNGIHQSSKVQKIKQSSICGCGSSTALQQVDTISSNSDIESDTGCQSSTSSLVGDNASNEFLSDISQLTPVTIKNESGLMEYCDFGTNMKVMVDEDEAPLSTENIQEIQEPEILSASDGNQNICRSRHDKTPMNGSRLFSSVKGLSLLSPKKTQVTRINTNIHTVFNSSNLSVSALRIPGISVMKETSDILDRWKNTSERDKDDRGDQNNDDDSSIRKKVYPSVNYASSFILPVESIHNTIDNPMKLSGTMFPGDGLTKCGLAATTLVTHIDYGQYPTVKKEYFVPSLSDLALVVLNSSHMEYIVDSQSSQPRPLLSHHGPEPPVLTRHQDIDRTLLRPVNLLPDLIPSPYSIKRHDR